MTERIPNPRRSLFSEAVKKHSSGDQVPASQDIDLSDLDLTQNTELTEAQQRAEEPKTVDLTDVDLTAAPYSSRAARGGQSRKSREELQAEVTASELDAQKYVRADRKAQSIRSRKAFQPGAGFYTTATADPSVHGKMLQRVKAGKAAIQPITAANGYEHVKNIHKELESFINNLPSLLRAKAAAHDSAADELAQSYADHPEVASHRYEASQIRDFLGEGPSVRDNLREIRDNRDSDRLGSISSGTPRTLERVLTPIKNRLVEAQAKVATIPITGKEEASGLGVKGQLSPNNKRTHLSIKKTHSYLVSLHKDINELVRPFGVGTETGPAYMDLQGTRLENITDKPSKPDVSTYQDARDDFAPGAEGRMSKPGHIWGDHETIAGKRTGNREQIPISKESIEMLKKRKGGLAKVHLARMRSIINTGLSPEQKAAAAQEDKDTTLYAYSPEAEEASKVKARAAGRRRTSKDGEEYEVALGATPKTTKRDGNKTITVSIDPRKVTTVGTHSGAVQQVAAGRASTSETEGHINTAVRALIDGRDIPAETMAHIESLPNKNKEQEKIATIIKTRHQEHQDAVAGAVADVTANKKISREHRAIFKREGTNPVDIIKLAKPGGV
jgi:hypothetical protein